MALVIKSWSVKSSPAVGEPYVKVVARASGLLSFILSLVGIDATTTLQVSATRIEFERGSLSGFIRRLTLLDHIGSTFYGRNKPWKTALVIFAICSFIGSAIGKSGFGGQSWTLLFFLLGLLGGGLYYFLNRELMIGFTEDSGITAAITFKRSVIEGQEIDENQLQKIIDVIENLIKKQTGDIGHIDLGGAPTSARQAGPAPMNFKDVMQGPASPAPLPPAAPPAARPAARATACSRCAAPITPDDVFCGSCGNNLK
jgi:hypothetical protein